MLQTDHVVDNRRHDFAGGLGVAMRHRYGDLLVAAEDHLGIGRAAAFVIDQGVVDAAKARTGVERDIFDAKNFEQIDDQVGTVTCGHKTSRYLYFIYSNQRQKKWRASRLGFVRQRAI